MCEWAGPVVDLLLEHVGSVQLCSRLTELLDSREEWHSIKRKSCKCQVKLSYAYARKETIFFHPLFNFLRTNVPHSCKHFPHTLSSVLSYSVTTLPPAPLQINDSDSDGERQTEIYFKLTSAKQTDKISKCGRLTAKRKKETLHKGLFRM